MAKPKTRRVAAIDALEKSGLGPVELTLEETEKLRDAWRRVYARPLKRSEGVWHRGKYDWHVFSYKDTFALSHQEARNAYASERCTEFVVLPNEKSDCACRVRTKRPPMLDGEQDVYVSPPDFSWTMVFTHEDGWLGPYFSRAVWVDKPPTPVPAAAKQTRTTNKTKNKRGKRKR